MLSFYTFRWFQSSLTHHNSCGPHWWLRSVSSQASEGYKLKAECLLLGCQYGNPSRKMGNISSFSCFFLFFFFAMSLVVMGENDN